jgi:hypothetical protein
MLAGIFSGTRAGLHNDRRPHLAGGFHNGLNLFQVIDIERWQTIGIFSSMVE